MEKREEERSQCVAEAKVASLRKRDLNTLEYRSQKEC